MTGAKAARGVTDTGVAPEEAPAKPAGGPTVIPLRSAIKYEDVEAKELHLDFDSLSGDDMAEIIKAAERDNGGSPFTIPALDPYVQRRVAARAAGVPIGLIGKLGAKDFLEVAGAARDFLLDL